MHAEILSNLDALGRKWNEAKRRNLKNGASRKRISDGKEWGKTMEKFDDENFNEDVASAAYKDFRWINLFLTLAERSRVYNPHCEIRRKNLLF